MSRRKKRFAVLNALRAATKRLRLE